jgi:hypothetical protein
VAQILRLAPFKRLDRWNKYGKLDAPCGSVTWQPVVWQAQISGDPTITKRQKFKNLRG